MSGAAQPDSVCCPICGHEFVPGLLAGMMYCPACGKPFDPVSGQDETVILPPSGSQTTARDAAISGSWTKSPRRFGDYDIIEEIARGGMGVVYLARQRTLKRVVALKVLRSGDNASPEERERFLREAKSAAGLSHPNIVPIHEFSIHQGQPYFTMDFVEGRPLDRLVESGPVKVRDAVRIIETVGRAISYAHSHGIIHRDLKPANIILRTDGQPLVTDFGLAVDTRQDASSGSPQRPRMTMDGSVMGTISYAPPEQAQGRIGQITEQSDVYSMGAVLYEMVTGRPPFTGFTQFELLRRVINQEPMAPRRVNPRIHPDVETIILKCLEKDPRRRYASAREFADDCQSFLRGEPISARPATFGYRCQRMIMRRPLLSFLVACVLLLSLILWIGVGSLRVLEREKEATQDLWARTKQELDKVSEVQARTEAEMRRDWRTEYSINFDYAFRWEADLERAQRLSLPWINPAQARLLADPPGLAMTSVVPVPERLSDRGDAYIGVPFAIPRDARLVIQLVVPEQDAGDLVVHLDADQKYETHLGTTVIRVGTHLRPGITVYRSDTVLAASPEAYMPPGGRTELVIERAEGKLRVLVMGQPLLECADPPPVTVSENRRLSLNVVEGTLAFYSLSVAGLGLSRNLVSSLLELAGTMAARGNTNLALRLYNDVLLEQTDLPDTLRAIRGYVRSLAQTMDYRNQTPVGVRNACMVLGTNLRAVGLDLPGELEYVIGLAYAAVPGTAVDAQLALEQFDRSAAVAYSAGVEAAGFGDLSRLESMLLHVRGGRLAEAARRFEAMYADGTMARLYDRFGAALAGGGEVALLLERAGGLLTDDEMLPTAASLLRAAACIAPSSRECASNFVRLAQVHEQRERPEQALESLNWARTLSPQWHRPYLEQARILAAMGQKQQAADMLALGRESADAAFEAEFDAARAQLEEQ